MPNNPYIELVKSHENIMVDTTKMRTHQWKWWDFFENKNSLVLEIGTGLGNFFSKQVRGHSDKNYIGMEIRYKRLFQTAEKCLWNKATYNENGQYESLKRPHPNPLLQGEGETLINNFVLLKEFGQKVWELFWEWELSETYIFFPDPWARKKAQLKNRLLQSQFLTDLHTATKKSWKLIIKTDHRWYFDFLLEELKSTKWKQTYISYDFENEPEFQNSETTEFQQLFRGQEIQINHIELEK